MTARSFRLGLMVCAAFLAVAMTGAAWLAWDGGVRTEDEVAADRIAPPGDAVALVAAPAAKRAPAPPAAASVQVEDAVFPPGAALTIRGTVRDDAGRPIAGAHVVAGIDARVGRPREAETETDGSYAIAGLDPEATWSLESWAEGFGRGPRAESVAATPRGLDVVYDLVLPRLGAIDVAVTGPGGAAIRHRLSIRRIGDEGCESVRAGSPIVPGRYRVVARAEGRAPVVRTVDVGAASVRCELRLDEPAVAIEGMLLAPDLTPMRGFVVRAVDPEAADWDEDRRDPTADDGTFRLEGLRRAAYTLLVDDAEFALDGGEGVEAPATGVRLVARDDARVTWRLVYPDSPAIDRSAEVDVWLDRLRRLATHWKGDRGSATVPGGVEVALDFRAQGCAPVRRTVRVRPGETADLGDLAPEAAFEVWGRVADGAGAPVLSANVVLRVGGTETMAATHQGGRFLARGLPRGDGSVAVNAPGFAFASAPFRSGQDDPVLVTLTPGGRLFVRGAPPGARIAAIGAGGARFEFAADDFGEACTRLAAGPWRIEAAGRDPVDAEIRDGATTTVRYGATMR